MKKLTIMMISMLFILSLQSNKSIAQIPPIYWALLGNTGTVDGINFLGTIDNVPLSVRVNNQLSGRIDNKLANTFWGYQAGLTTSGQANTATGFQALYSNVRGNYNTAAGYQSLFNTTSDFNTGVGYQALYSNTLGRNNTAVGYGSLLSNVTGDNNTASGVNALNANTFGYDNSAYGKNTLLSNTSGFSNTASGLQALMYNTTGSYNTATGAIALAFNTTGISNVATGDAALLQNTTGNFNTATGTHAMNDNTSGDYNTATGYGAFYSNTTGFDNTVIGSETLPLNTTGYSNTASGRVALYYNTTGNNNTANGAYSLLNNMDGSCNTALGYSADVSSGSLTNATAIGCSAVVDASDKVRIGNTAVTVIEGQVAFSYPSDGRFKKNVTETVKGLDFIMKLRPVVYNFETQKYDAFLHKDLNIEALGKMNDSVPGKRMAVPCNSNFSKSESIRQSGFIAQEVDKAAQESGYDFNGVIKPENEEGTYSLAYSQFVVPLVKAVQELNKQNESQQKELEELKKQVAVLSQIIGKTEIDHTNSATIVELSPSNSIILNQNVPNPFAEQTTITYHIPDNAKQTQIVFYDLSGKTIKKVELKEKGTGKLQIFGPDLNNGTYTYSILSDGKVTDTKKMIKID